MPRPSDESDRTQIDPKSLACNDHIGDELLVAAHAMERALNTGKRIENNRVWLPTVQGFNPGEFASSVQGCQARILETVGESLTYEDLICLGAFAFRVGVHNAFCPSAGHPCCGFNCVKNSHAALPWRTRSFDSFPWSEEKEDRAAFEADACAAIKASIDRGVPVHYGGEEDGLIIGYADEGRRWLCLHPYHKGGRTPFWHDDVNGFAGGSWPWTIMIWEEPKAVDERILRDDLVRTALLQAVDMWTAGQCGDYIIGDAAYAYWLNWLEDVQAGRVVDPKPGMQGNGWCYDVLIHCRRIAAPWLREEAARFDAPARKYLLVAADHCEAIATELMEDLKCPWDLALPPKRVDDWTDDMRAKQIRRLQSARKHDRAAIAAIAQALEANAQTP
jgi:hypothetical protein